MKVSIIVSVYNTPKVNLERCVRSLQNQTYKDIEIMLMDKGSTDASKIYCNNYSAVFKLRHWYSIQRLFTEQSCTL